MALLRLQAANAAVKPSQPTEARPQAKADDAGRHRNKKQKAKVCCELLAR